MISKLIAYIFLSIVGSCSLMHANTTTDYYQKILDKSREVVSKEKFINDGTFIQRVDSLNRLSPSKQNIVATGELVFNICTHLYEHAFYHETISYLSYCHPMLKEILPNTKGAQIIYLNILDQYGISYQNIGLVNHGLNIFFKALALAEHLGLTTETAILYNNIAATYMRQQQYLKADSLYTKAIRINEVLKDKEKLFVNYNNLSVTAAKQNNYNKALEYAFLALHQLDAQKDSNMIMLMQRNIGGIYLRKKEFSLALQQLEEVKKYQEKHRQLPYLLNTYNMMAEIYANKEDSFVHYLKKALTVANESQTAEDNSGVYYKLYKHYEGKQDYARANYYLKQYADMRDSLFASEKQSQINNLLDMYVEEQQQHQKIEQIQLKQFNTIRQMRIISVISVIIILVGFTYSIFRLRKERKNYFNKVRRHLSKRQDMLSGQQDRIMCLIEEVEKQDELLNLNEKKRTVLSLQAMRNQEFTSLLIEELKQLLLELNPRDNTTKMHIRDILSRLNQMNNDNAQKEFVGSFENIYQKFYDALGAQYPNLTVREMRLCALIHIGLSNKEIADITFREIRSVEAARNRLRKKLALPQHEDLSKFLMQFRTA